MLPFGNTCGAGSTGAITGWNAGAGGRKGVERAASCWEDDSLDFWENVRRNRWFPASCLACGGSLPERAVVAAFAPDRTARSVP